jgi:tRNA(His) guanylyltransferase
VVRRESKLFERRTNELCSSFASLFSSLFVQNWAHFFQDTLIELPFFTGTCFVLPTRDHLLEYIHLKQNECHNRQLNGIVFNALLGKQIEPEAAISSLQTKYASKSAKNELLFTEFNMNYNEQPEMFRKGCFLALNLLDPTQQERCNVSIDTFHEKINQQFFVKHKLLQ